MHGPLESQILPCATARKADGSDAVRTRSTNSRYAISACRISHTLRLKSPVFSRDWRLLRRLRSRSVPARCRTYEWDVARQAPGSRRHQFPRRSLGQQRPRLSRESSHSRVSRRLRQCADKIASRLSGLHIAISKLSSESFLSSASPLSTHPMFVPLFSRKREIGSAIFKRRLRLVKWRFDRPFVKQPLARSPAAAFSACLSARRQRLSAEMSAWPPFRQRTETIYRTAKNS